MMTPRETVPRDIRAALENALKMHNSSSELGRSLGLPASGLPATIGIHFGTLMRAANGCLVPSTAARKIEFWYKHAGRFLPKIEQV